ADEDLREVVLDMGGIAEVEQGAGAPDDGLLEPDQVGAVGVDLFGDGGGARREVGGLDVPPEVSGGGAGEKVEAGAGAVGEVLGHDADVGDGGGGEELTRLKGLDG